MRPPATAQQWTPKETPSRSTVSHGRGPAETGVPYRQSPASPPRSASPYPVGSRSGTVSNGPSPLRTAPPPHSPGSPARRPPSARRSISRARLSGGTANPGPLRLEWSLVRLRAPQSASPQPVFPARPLPPVRPSMTPEGWTSGTTAPGPGPISMPADGSPPFRAPLLPSVSPSIKSATSRWGSRSPRRTRCSPRRPPNAPLTPRSVPPGAVGLPAQWGTCPTEVPQSVELGPMSVKGRVRWLLS